MSGQLIWNQQREHRGLKSIQWTLRISICAMASGNWQNSSSTCYAQPAKVTCWWKLWWIFESITSWCSHIPTLIRHWDFKDCFVCRGSSTHATVGILPEPLGWPWQFSRVGFTFQLELEVNSLGYRYTSPCTCLVLSSWPLTLPLLSTLLLDTFYWLPMQQANHLGFTHSNALFWDAVSRLRQTSCFKKQVQTASSARINIKCNTKTLQWWTEFHQFCEISIAVNTSGMTSSHEMTSINKQHLVSDSKTFLRRSKGSRWRSLHGWWKKSG